MDAMTEIMRALWIGGLAATPIALGVGVVCRAKAWSAATRHLLWLAVLASFVTPALGVFIWRPTWFRTEQLLGVTERVIATLPVGASEPEAKVVADAAGRQDSLPKSSFVGPILLPSFTPESSARFAMGEPSMLRQAMPAVSSPSPRQAGSSGSISRTPFMATTGIGTTAGNLATPLGLAPAGSSRVEQPARVRVPASPARVVADRGPVNAPIAAVPVITEKAATPRESSAAGFLRSSVSMVASMRDALASASPIPAGLWLGVAGLLIVVRVARTIRASRLIRTSEPANLRTCAMVAVAAEQIGLSRVPEARMVNDAVSPMIWCGLRPRLILPRGLWNALDESSQRAVLVHELAHVRRWDHVLCWFDLVIGSLYWWHPLSWWARRRLHDEAEASCDAWVVNALPESRRAYATALLATKSFVSMKGRVNGPWLSGAGAGGIGVLSGSAKKMARRITMIMTERVMTQKSASKLSKIGACAAASVIALSAFVMPGLACPPEEKEAKAEKQAAEKRAAELANSAGVIVVTPDGKKIKVKRDNGGAQFFGEAPALEAMKARKSGQGFAPMAPMAPMAPTPPTPAAAPTPPVGVLYRVGPDSVAIAKGGQCGASRSKMMMSSSDLKQGRIARVYVLPEGKAEAFYELMSRSDVPILVQQNGNSIKVYATEGQHPTIAGFIKIISPDAAGSAGERGSSSGSGQSSGRSSARNQSSMNADSIRAYQEQARAYQQAIRELNTSRANVERNASRARAEAERVRGQQEQLEAAAEQMSAQAEQMAEGAAKQKMEAAAEKLRQRAEAAEHKIQKSDEQVETIEQQVEELENRTEEIENRAEELQDRISEASNQDGDEIAEIDMQEMSEIDEVGEMGEIVGAGEPGQAADVMIQTDEDEGPAAMDDESDDEGETPVATPVGSAMPAIAPVPPVAPVAAPLPGTPVAPAVEPAKAPKQPGPSAVVASTRHT
ncbi:MAG: M56 family metallopeptidase [Phycisphaerales bacterium]